MLQLIFVHTKILLNLCDQCDIQSLQKNVGILSVKFSHMASPLSLSDTFTLAVSSGNIFTIASSESTFHTFFSSRLRFHSKRFRKQEHLYNLSNTCIEKSGDSRSSCEPVPPNRRVVECRARVQLIPDNAFHERANIPVNPPLGALIIPRFLSKTEGAREKE